MAKRKTRRTRRGRKGVKCTRVRVRGHTKTVCRSSKTGRIVKGGGRSSLRKGRGKGRMVCPKRWRGLSVKYNRKAKRCYVRTKAGGMRFVKKVRSRRRSKR